MLQKTNKTRSQQFFQIIMPMISFFIIIGICGFLIIGGLHNGTINLEKLGDISAAFLLILIIPPTMFFFATVIAFIYLTSRYSKWIQILTPNIQSVMLRIEASINKICETSAHPFIFFESIYAIFKKK
jgi:hypothetical protein